MEIHGKEDIMYVITGLGNPGRQYEHTRHNAGFDVINVLSEQYDIPVTEKKHRALLGKGRIGGQQVLLVKPQTFMNLSGESVAEILDFYKLDPTDSLIVISDDVALEAGTLRIRKKGSAGGHNGLKNIIAHCHTQEFARVRVGVGDPQGDTDMIAHVLGRFPKDLWPRMEQTYEKAAEAVACMITESADHAMSKYNGKVEQ
jgi:PTH1 family peptidyl-tRNA hydrolase